MNPEQPDNSLTAQLVEVGNPELAWLGIFAMIVVALVAWAGVRSTRALIRFSSASTLPESGRSSNKFLSCLLLVSTTLLLTLALVDLRWGKSAYEVPQKGLEVVFALDVSRSMLAQDASPNRLIRAKQQIKDLVSEMAGDRIGLVAFAGEAQQVVPLTNHYDDFEIKLDSIGPHSVPLGGSSLGVAIKAAADSFIGKTDGNRTIVLFTDGEDQESNPIELARQLHDDQGIRIFTIGLGDMDQGARIPVQSSSRGSFVEYEGQQVWSKLNGRILKQIATETEAAYIPAGTKRVDMTEVYHRYIDNVEKTQFDTAKIDAFTPRFQWFAGAALVCLLLEVFLGTKTKKSVVSQLRSTTGTSNVFSENQMVEPDSRTRGRRNTIGAASILIALLAAGPSIAQDDTIERQINNANELVRTDKAAEAIEAFAKIEVPPSSESQQLRDYNLAIAQYRNSNFDMALKLFRDSAAAKDLTIAANSRFNIGNCHYSKAIAHLSNNSEQAVQQLEDAITNYRSALRLDRSIADARTNIELARKLLDQLKENRNQEDQQQPENQQEDSEHDQQQRDNDEQEPTQSQNDSKQEDSKQDESKSDQTGSEQQKQDSEQIADEEQNQSDSADQKQQQSSDDSQESDGNNQSETDQSDASDRQQQGEQQPQPDSSKSDPGQQSPAKENASQNQSSAEQSSEEGEEKKPTIGDGQQDEKKDGKTDGELTSSNAAENESSEADKAAAYVDPIAKMTREEALKLLQSVRDRDMLRRFQQQRRQRSRRVRVEKDW